MVADLSTTHLATAQSPIYLVSDVARYVHLHYQTARSWIALIPGREVRLPPAAGLNFLDLVSILIIRSLRDIGVNPRRIRRAEEYLTHHYGPYPLAKRNIWTNGYHVFFDPDSPLREEVPQQFLIAADSGGQQAFVHLLHQYLRRISYSEEGLAIRWSPKDRVELDPSKQFGQPCIKGSRVLTQSIYLLHTAGDSNETIMNAFLLSAEDVREAIDWEESLIKKAA